MFTSDCIISSTARHELGRGGVRPAAPFMSCTSSRYDRDARTDWRRASDLPVERLEHLRRAVGVADLLAAEATRHARAVG
jgi:hypothetical protein